jgi:HAD superfamily hydrolase (TIGR01484 family)
MADIPSPLCRALRFLFVDIDDTLTSGGMLPDSSYAALWDLFRAGIRVAPVTGRPAGWCDHIARMWPVAGVIGENGAFYFAYDREKRRMKRRFSAEKGILTAQRDSLARIAEKILRAVPGTAVAADQFFRISDYAIDFREDVPPLTEASVDAICSLLSAEGVSFKVSSIHINFWLGDFDKLSCLKLYLKEEHEASIEEFAEKMIFIGDSPNDEPLFAGVPHTIGVGNLADFIKRITHPPEFITRGVSAAGFCEAARTILDWRASAQ